MLPCHLKRGEGALRRLVVAAFEQDLAREITLAKIDSALMNSVVVSPKAAEAAHCAADQKKYWEMHEKLFAPFSFQCRSQFAARFQMIFWTNTRTS